MAEYRLYKRRWFILLHSWVTFASITYYTNVVFRERECGTIFNVIFMALSIPLGFVAMWGVDRFRNPPGGE
ncbi:hypothetical protein M3Y99_00487100 [Aphelenchoides fujianensis]|nr:hypothetical protein M3Y99_00487100 [Aphelenchoides fujianensis]